MPRIPELLNRRVVVPVAQGCLSRDRRAYWVDSPVEVLTHVCQGSNQVPTLIGGQDGNRRKDRPGGQPGYVQRVPRPCTLSMTYKEQETAMHRHREVIPDNRTGMHEAMVRERRLGDCALCTH